MSEIFQYGSRPKEAVDEMIDKFDMKPPELTEDVVDYRMGLLSEETQETIGAWRTKNPEEIVDGHVDVITIALGNLAIFGVSFEKAMEQVMQANMAKEKGKRKESDPDGQSIIKPEGWVKPDHKDNHGELDRIYGEIDAIFREN